MNNFLRSGRSSTTASEWAGLCGLSKILWHRWLFQGLHHKKNWRRQRFMFLCSLMVCYRSPCLHSRFPSTHFLRRIFTEELWIYEDLPCKRNLFMPIVIIYLLDVGCKAPCYNDLHRRLDLSLLFMYRNSSMCCVWSARKIHTVLCVCVCVCVTFSCTTGDQITCIPTGLLDEWTVFLA